MNIAAILDAKGSEVVTIKPDDLVLLALHEMSNRDIGALVVTEDGDHVLGVLTERNIARGLVHHGAHLLSLSVSKVMSRPAPVCRPDDSTADCMLTMTRSRQRHLPVTVDGMLRGLVSIGDLVKNCLDELELELNVVREAYIVGRRA